MNDTIVVFDRIRENIKLFPNRDRKELFNYALNSTLSRTLNTGVSTLLVVLIIFLFGGASIQSFTFAMLLGVISGTFGTLFVATPIAHRLYSKSREKESK